ncbi:MULTISPECIES: hypothetical protein [unclassified Xanthomonas]|nr:MULTISPECIES: hypothetical protein [unclassified Xanthomonas]
MKKPGATDLAPDAPAVIAHSNDAPDATQAKIACVCDKHLRKEKQPLNLR